MEWILVYAPPVRMSRPSLAFPFSKEVLFSIKSSWPERQSLLIFEMQSPMLLFLCLFKTIRNEKQSLEDKMDNPMFVDEDTIPMVDQDEDYDDYKTTDTSRVDETSFIEPDTTEATSTSRLRQKVK